MIMFSRVWGRGGGTVPLLKRCPYSLPVIVLGILGFLVLLVTLLLVLVHYDSLPDKVPIHFGFDGTADEYGPKWTLWVLFGIDVSVFLLMVVVGHFPRTWNTIKQLNEANRWAVCNATRIFLYVINLAMLLLFGSIFLAILYDLMLLWLFYVLLAVPLLATLIYWFVLHRI